MISALPALHDAVAKERDLWRPNTPGLHVTCGDILLPALRSALSTGTPPTERSQLFRFIERMAESSDASVVNVVEVTICEGLLDMPIARSHMGPKTLAASMRIENHLNRLAQEQNPVVRFIGRLGRRRGGRT
jgi:hypothetical protein